MIQTICEGDLTRFLRETERYLEDQNLSEKEIPTLEMRVISFSPVGEYVVSIFKFSNEYQQTNKQEFEEEMLENAVQDVVSKISPITALGSAILDVIDLHQAFKGMQYYEKFKYSSRLSTEHVKVFVAQFSTELKEMIISQQSDRIKKLKNKLSISNDPKIMNKEFLTLCPELETQCPGAMKILGNI